MVGIGARRGVTADEVRAAVEHLAGLVPLDGARYASVDAKAAEQGILDAIAPARLETRPAADLARVPRGPGNRRVEAAVGTPSVAEAAALLVAGSGAVLLVPKTVVGRVTVACASGQGDP